MILMAYALVVVPWLLLYYYAISAPLLIGLRVCLYMYVYCVVLLLLLLLLSSESKLSAGTGVNPAGDGGTPMAMGIIPTNIITYVRIQKTNISHPRQMTAFNNVFYSLFCSKIQHLPQTQSRFERHMW